VLLLGVQCLLENDINKLSSRLSDQRTGGRGCLGQQQQTAFHMVTYAFSTAELVAG
jgi:hypothetical protein